MRDCLICRQLSVDLDRGAIAYRIAVREFYAAYDAPETAEFDKLGAAVERQRAEVEGLYENLKAHEKVHAMRSSGQIRNPGRNA